VRLCVIRLDTERRAIRLLGLRGVVELAVGVAQIDVRVRRSRLSGNRSLQVRDGRRRLVSGNQGLTEFDVGIAEVGPESRGFLEVADGSVEIRPTDARSCRALHGRPDWQV
jgi:hypothetical protein